MQINLSTPQQRALQLLALGQDMTPASLAADIINQYLSNVTDEDFQRAQEVERTSICQALGLAVASPVQAEPTP